MFSMLSWWYLGGLQDQFGRTKKRLLKVYDQFSIPLLLKTLFHPFRMIDADKSYGPSLDAKIRAWLDKMVSRMIGGFIRTIVVIIGIIVLITTVVISALMLVLWVILPILPFVVLAVSITIGGVWN
jgi:hypothetical protein